MTSPRYRNTILHVIATEKSSVREIDDSGKPILDCRVIGKSSLNGPVIEEGVKLPYHAHYIARLKEGTLLAGDIATAKLAGVAFTPKAEPIMKSKKQIETKDSQ